MDFVFLLRGRDGAGLLLREVRRRSLGQNRAVHCNQPLILAHSSVAARRVFGGRNGRNILTNKA